MVKAGSREFAAGIISSTLTKTLPEKKEGASAWVFRTRRNVTHGWKIPQYQARPWILDPKCLTKTIPCLRIHANLS